MDKIRYSNQISLPEIGESGQEKLNKARVAIAGCGGLGSIVAGYLAGAGIGGLVLVDGDRVHISNLHRQVLYAGNFENYKAIYLKEHLEKLNPEINITAENTMVSKLNIADIFKDADLVVECTDNVFSKYFINDYCAENKIPMVYGAIGKYTGYVSLFRNKLPGDINLRDVFPETNPTVDSCTQGGVLNTIAGITGLFQANEVLKYILGIGEPLIGKLLTYDALTNKQFTFSVQKQ